MTTGARGDERFYELLGERRRLVEEADGLGGLLAVHDETRSALEGARPNRVNSIEEWEAFREDRAAFEELAGGADEARSRLGIIRERLDAIPGDLLGWGMPAGLWVRHGDTGVRVDEGPAHDRPVLTEALWPAIEASPTGEIADVREQERVLAMGRVGRLVHRYPDLPRVMALGGVGAAAVAALGGLAYLIGDDVLRFAGDTLSGPPAPQAEGPRGDPATPIDHALLLSQALAGAALIMSLAVGVLQWTRHRRDEGLVIVFTGAGVFLFAFYVLPLILGMLGLS